MASRFGAVAAGLLAMATTVGGYASSTAAPVEARLSRTSIVVGEATTLEVTVDAGLGGVKAPEFELPPGIELLGQSRSESVQLMNGRMSRRIAFRYELGGLETGRFTVGPIKVELGGTAYLSGSLRLSVTAAEARTGAAGSGQAILRTEVRPARAYVGQELLLSVKLLQRVALAQDPDYAPPSTPGFWADRPSPPESFYADAGGERVLVTETRTRLYPLAAGKLTIGPAAALVVIRTDEPDPFSLFGRGSTARPMQLASESLRVEVAPLPRPAPAGFIGAVGDFEALWWCDRGETAQDAPFTVTLELRGSGNLPLVRTPEWSPAGSEIYASQSDDSLGRSGTHEPGRKRYVWTLLAKRAGSLTLEPPALAWFDPAARRYRTAALEPIEITVVEPTLSQRGEDEPYPSVFLRHPATPGSRGPLAWAWAMAGLMVGAAIQIWRRSGVRDAGAADRARAAEWRRALQGPARGPDWWRSAEECAAWLGERGRLVHHIRHQILNARYAGESAEEGMVRLRLLEHLGEAVPPGPSRLPMRLAALALGAAGLACAWLLGPQSADSRLATLARAAEDQARRGEWDRARAAWEDLWRVQPDAGVAARVAWSWAQDGQMGPATLWVMRGMPESPRDAGLRWVAQRVREGGGMVGESSPGSWPSSLEASLAAALAATLAVLAWPRRWAAAGALALALAGALSPATWRFLQSREPRVVVMREASLAPADGEPLLIEPGQVLVVRRVGPEMLDVQAGPGVEGAVDRGAVEWVGTEG
jgi:hypothetical protein